MVSGRLWVLARPASPGGVFMSPVRVCVSPGRVFMSSGRVFMSPGSGSLRSEIMSPGRVWVSGRISSECRDAGGARACDLLSQRFGRNQGS